MDKRSIIRGIKAFPFKLVDLKDFNSRCSFGFHTTASCATNEKEVTAEQEKLIKAFWQPYLSDWQSKYAFDIKRFGLYNQTNTEGFPLQYYIPDSWYYAIIDRCLTKPLRADYLDDKNLYDLYFHDVSKPATVVRHIDGVFLDKDYRHIDKGEVVRLCQQAGHVICKPATDSSGGAGIEFWSEDKGEAKLLEILSRPNMIAQCLQKQHETLNRIYPHSLNTVRVLTLMKEDQCYVLSSVLRTGANGSKVDNVSSGGFACGIDPESGQLKAHAYNNKGESIEVHPQGAVFAQYAIPNFHQFKVLAEDLAYRLCGISKLISWDFAVSEAGTPVLIEANLSWCELDFHQMCNGPVFGADTVEILEWFKAKYL